MLRNRIQLFQFPKSVLDITAKFRPNTALLAIGRNLFHLREVTVAQLRLSCATHEKNEFSLRLLRGSQKTEVRSLLC